MKALKRSLAVLLSVLMVAFSVPFSASASEVMGNFSVYAYSCEAQENSTNTLPVLWGPTLGATETAEPLTGTIEAGTVFALAYVVNPAIPSIMIADMRGNFDPEVIVPVTPVAKKSGSKYKPNGWKVNYSEQAWIDGAAGGWGITDMDLDAAGIQVDGSFSYFNESDPMKPGTPVTYCTCDFGTGITLTGNTIFWEAVPDPADPDGENYVDYVMDGTLIGVCTMEAKVDLDADNLYQYFDYPLDNEELCFITDKDKVSGPVTFGPSKTTVEEDVYTYYYYTDTERQNPVTVKVPAGQTPTAPELSQPSPWRHIDGFNNPETGEPAHTRIKPVRWELDESDATGHTYYEYTEPDFENCDLQETEAAIELIHTQDQLQDGQTARLECSVCGYTEGGEVIVAEHTWETNEVAATCTVQAHTEDVCTYCGKVESYDYHGELAAHDFSVPTGETVDNGCTEKISVEYKCANCDETELRAGDEYGSHGTITAVPAVAATCTEGGNDAYWTCEDCGKIFADADATTELAEIPATPAKGHTLTAHEAVEANCTEGGVDAYWTCDECSKMFADADATTEITAIPTTPAKGHTWRNDAEVPATRAEAGVEAGRTCTVCGEKEGYAVIPALGVDITVAASSLGTVTINGEEISNATKNVAWASDYVLTATPKEGAKFVAWVVNNKIVSEEETYVTSAYADMTYEPVFTAVDSGEFLISFVDVYGNVIATKSSTELPLSELPAAPEFAGLTFTGWDKTLDQVNEMTAAGKVTAIYENDTVKKFNVTAQAGATIVVDGVECGTSTQVTYNTLVTVKADGATSWTANGSVAAYGEEYTFYCGSDIEVNFDIDTAVNVAPAVAKVSVDKGTDFKVKFLATRSIPEGFQLVESGFVYGKAMSEDDLKLGNVGKTINGAKVKQVVCNNKGADGQFALTYGVSAMNANATASAYIIYKQGSETKVAYAYMYFDYKA